MIYFSCIFCSRTSSIYLLLYITDVDVSFIIPVEDEEDLFVIGLGTELTALKWSENCNQNFTTKRLISVDENKLDNRWNDAKADHAGFLYAG